MYIYVYTSSMCIYIYKQPALSPSKEDITIFERQNATNPGCGELPGIPWDMEGGVPNAEAWSPVEFSFLAQRAVMGY